MTVGVQAWGPGEVVAGRLGGRASHRVGTVEQRVFPIATGLPGYNLHFSRDTVTDGFYSPRHRHCWDQLRFVLDGALNIGKVDLQPGDCCYFPEAVAYGPQKQVGDATVLILQFTGAGGRYYPTWQELEEAADQLRATGGEFVNGVFRGVRADGSRFNQDGYEAMWAAQQQRKLEYAQPRYGDVVVLKSQRYSWVTDRRRPGVAVKTLGSFTECGSTVGMVRLAAGTTLEGSAFDGAVDGRALSAPEIRYVLDGSVEVDGRTYPEGSCFWIPAGVAAPAAVSAHGAELYVISLPLYTGELLLSAGDEPAHAG